MDPRIREDDGGGCGDNDGKKEITKEMMIYPCEMKIYRAVK